MLEGGNVHDKPLPPLLKVPTLEQTNSLAEHRKVLDVIEKALAKELGRFTYADPLEGKSLPETLTDELAAQSLLAWSACC